MPKHVVSRWQPWRVRLGDVLLRFERRRQPKGKYLFDDLPVELRWKAQGWLAHLCEKWRGNLPGWRRAILIGRARWLALNPPSSDWGRTMLAKRGGYAVQESYRWMGRIGEKHPAHRAARVSATHRRWRKLKKEEEQKREETGLGPMSSHRFLPLE